MENVRMSEKLEQLMRKASMAREDLIRGRYSNGSYAGSAVMSAENALTLLEFALRDLMKDAIRAEAVADTKDQIIAQFTVQIH